MTVAPSRSAPTRTDNALGILRLLLAALVLATHARLLGGFPAEPLARWTGDLSLGTVAVAAFFCLSGCLVASSYDRLQSLPRYLWHRFLRLAPASWVCLGVTAFLFTPVAWLLHPEPRPPASALASPAFDYVFHNLFSPRAIISVPPFPSGVPWGADWNGSLWTLFYEASCYLMIAVIGLLGLLGRRRTLGFVVLLAMPLLHVAWHLFPELLPSHLARLFDTPGKLLALHFLIGAALAVAPQRLLALLRPGRVSLVLVTLLVASWFTPWHPWLSPFLMPGLLLTFWRSGPLARWERHLGGDYSYGVYLYHYPVGQLLAAARIHHLGLLPYTFCILAIGLAMAWVSWRLVEAPALRLKNLRLRPSLSA